MRLQYFAFVIAIAFPMAAPAQQVVVIPAVADDVDGVHGSKWETEVLIIDKARLEGGLTIRRNWVCVPDGGFVDDPADRPTWGTHGRILRLEGHQLLQGTDSNLGAVALEIEGGEAIVVSRTVDVSRGLDGFAALYGQGQLVMPFDEPLLGPSHIPYLGGHRNTTPPPHDDVEYWEFHRNNIGLVNPNPEPMVVTSVVIPFGTEGETLLPPREFWDPEPETISVQVPAYGWKQFYFFQTHTYADGMWDLPKTPETGFIISLVPNKEIPYHAYGSVNFTPNPGVGHQLFSDPMFVPAEPGYVAPAAETVPPK